LLELDNADRPDDLFTLLNLGATLFDLATPKKDRGFSSSSCYQLGPKADTQQFNFILKTLASPKTPITINQFVHSQKI